jgi:hypothetical protein
MMTNILNKPEHRQELVGGVILVLLGHSCTDTAVTYTSSKVEQNIDPQA